MKRAVPAEIHPAALGFSHVPEDELALHYGNARPFRNEVSPFCLTKSRFRFSRGGCVVDPFYGLCYDAGCELPKWLYGHTTDLPSYAGDHLSDMGFLRVPFRRIPRHRVHSRVEFDRFVSNIQSADPNLITLFRGQTSEYLLNRGELAGDYLYGDKEALEPSLLPSASRHGVQLEDIGPEWSTAVQLFMWQWVERLKRQTVPSQTLEKISHEMNSLVCGYGLWAFLLALAQHYGLPSTGLDVTDRPEIALFFALTRLRPKAAGSRLMAGERVAPGERYPVVYIFAVGKRAVMDFNHVRPFGFPLGRPDRQSAFFLPTSWGHSTNSIACGIYIALYLDPAGDWGQIPSTRELFPSTDEDSFAASLERMREWSSSAEFHHFIDMFYSVE